MRETQKQTHLMPRSIASCLLGSLQAMFGCIEQRMPGRVILWQTTIVTLRCIGSHSGSSHQHTSCSAACVVASVSVVSWRHVAGCWNRSKADNLENCFFFYCVTLHMDDKCLNECALNLKASCLKNFFQNFFQYVLLITQT